jgi:hypothetical protein
MVIDDGSFCDVADAGKCGAAEERENVHLPNLLQIDSSYVRYYWK